MPTAHRIQPSSSEAISLTSALVAAASPNPPGDERAVAAVLEEFLGDTPGVETRRFAPRPERPSLTFTAGEGERVLTLAAHIDTHPIVGDWQFDPLGEIQADRIYGRGTTDNKGAVAAMAVAFRETVRRGIPDCLRLVLVANADEELGGAEGIAFLCRQPSTEFGAVVVAEPSGVFDPWEALYVAARGTSRFSLSCHGDRTHSSLAGRDGVVSALETLEDVVADLRSNLPVLSQRHPLYGPGGSLTVVRLASGEGYGVVPSTARAEIELRLIPGADQRTIERSVTAIVSRNQAQLEFAEGSLRWMGPSEVGPDHPLTRAAAAGWNDVFGELPQLACFPGGTDARLFIEAGWPALAGVGPGALVRAHQPDEFVTFDEVSTAVQLYQAIIARTATERSEGWI